MTSIWLYGYPDRRVLIDAEVTNGIAYKRPATRPQAAAINTLEVDRDGQVTTIDLTAIGLAIHNQVQLGAVRFDEAANTLLIALTRYLWAPFTFVIPLGDVARAAERLRIEDGYGRFS